MIAKPDNTPDTTNTPDTIKHMSSTVPYRPIPPKLTPEQLSKGGLNRAAKIREEKKTFRQRLAEKLDERAEQLIDVALAAGEKGDWRATLALIEQVYGKPKETIEVNGDLRLARGVDALMALSVEELAAKRAELATRFLELEAGDDVAADQPPDGPSV